MIPKDYRFTSEHEWIHPESGNNGKVGLADYAQSQLGDIVFLDLPALGTSVEQGKKMGEVESVKAVSDIFAPASGKVLEINQAVVDEPKLVNEDPYGAGWLVRIELSRASELDKLMDSPRYDTFVAGLIEKESQ
jgi:glycine cleavage system H protein